MKDDRIKQYFAIVEEEKSQFKCFIIQRILREDNEDADRLAKLESSTHEDLASGIILEHLPQPSIKSKKERKVNMVSLMPGWASQIIKYLKDGQLPEGKEEARKTRMWASRYLLLDDVLYKRSFTLPLSRCLSKEEADYAL